MNILNRIPRGVVVITLAIMAWMVFAPLLVFAQEVASDIVVTVPPTDVVLNWGDFAAILLANLAKPDSVAWTLFGLAMTWLVAQLPGPAKWAFNAFRVEQLLTNAIAGAANSTKGAVQGKALNVDVGSEVLAKALQYALDNGSAALIKWMGGEAGVQQKLVARIPMASEVDGGELAAKAATVTGAVTVDGSAPGSVS